MKPETLTKVTRWATAVVAFVAFAISFISVGHVSSDSQLGLAGWGVPAIVEGGIVAVSCARIFAELRDKRGATWLLGFISLCYVALAVAFNLMHLSDTLSGVIVAVAAPVTLFVAAETFLWMTKVQMETPQDDSERKARMWSIIKRHRAVTNAVRVLSASNQELSERVGELEQSHEDACKGIYDLTHENENLKRELAAMSRLAQLGQPLDSLPPFTSHLLTAIVNGDMNDEHVLQSFSEEHGVAVTSLKRTVSLFNK
jgi:hypothetical protein